jgi:hypothetical protein
LKQVIGGNGADTTAATNTYLASHRKLFLANLFLLGDQEDPAAQFLTSWRSPLSWPVQGTFKPAKITRGPVTSKIGLEVTSLDIEWTPKVTPFTANVASANPYQLAQLGFYDNKTFRLWRTIMPTRGDANTLGAYILFGGRVADCSIERGNIKLTINSFLDVVNQLVPPNVIEVTNTLANYKGATPVLADGEARVPTFTVAAPSTETNILGVCTGPTANKIYGDDKFKYGYLVFTSGSLAGFWSAVATSNNFQPIPGGPHYNQLIVYSPFPWDPTAGDQFYVSTHFPIEQADGSYIGFPYVPAPETAV